MKNGMILLVSMLLIGTAIAEEKTAENLVQSMKKADMTYRQLMDVMGKSSAMMHEGILRQNKQMVEVGANYIFTHPAPNHKPWALFEEADQQEFKQSLVAYDEILDVHTKKIVEAANQEKWTEAAQASQDLMSSCTSYHAMWRDKVK